MQGETLAGSSDVNEPESFLHCARTLYAGFRRYDDNFRRITRRARRRFEARDWSGAQSDRVEREELWEKAIGRCGDALRAQLGAAVRDHELWHHAKEIFGARVDGFGDAELARTFFTSVSRRLLETVGVDPAVEFVLDLEHDPATEAPPPTRIYVNWDDSQRLFRYLLSELCHELPAFEDLERDVHFVSTEVDTRVAEHYGPSPTLLRVEMLATVFYQSTRACLIGHVAGDGWTAPIAIELAHRRGGVAVEAVHMSGDEFSILFGFTRAYFFVDAEPVRGLVRFLRQQLPDKPLDEVYTLLGRVRQGKTERYRALARHLETRSDRFVISPGVRGLVMICFTLPGHHLVFKVIRDSFPPSKRVTHEQVIQRYRLVSRHDRVGRMIDVAAFRHLAFSLDDFSAEVLAELRRDAANTVRIEAGRVIFDHLYMERRVRPLDLFLPEAAHERAVAAVIDYGRAIKEMAAINIFPGDMMLKNFGITRHDRVIFYDFDEVTLLTECNFRALPRAHDDFLELSDQVWFEVGDNDVFPEQFGAFLGLAPPLRAVFMEHHGDLLTLAFWRHAQARCEAQVTPVLAGGSSTLAKRRARR